MIQFSAVPTYRGFRGSWLRVSFLLVIAVVLALAAPPLPGSPQDQEKVREDVLVVNQEVVARVLEGGRPVGGLRKADFTLLVDGRETGINGFWEVRHRMKPSGEKPAAGTVRPGRLFVLVFWLYEPEVPWAEALDQFFRETWRPGDRVVLAFGNQQFEINRPEDRDPVLVEFSGRFNRHLGQQRLERERMFQDLEAMVGDYRDDAKMIVSQPDEDVEGNPIDKTERYRGALSGLRSRYFNLLNEFRRRYLDVDEDQLRRFAASLKALDSEKWVLLFTQHETLPLLRAEGTLREFVPAGLAQELSRMFSDAERLVQSPVAKAPYPQALRTEALGARATFHLLLLDTRRQGKEIAEFADRQQAPSGWEATFRDIGRDTGGTVLDGNQLRRAVAEASEREDIHYVLTFVPPPGGGAPHDLKLAVARPGASVVFARRLEPPREFPLAVTAVRFQQPDLEIDLTGYRRTFEQDKLGGRVTLTVRACQGDREVDRTQRELILPEARMTASLKLKLAETGSYQLEIEARDLATGKTAPGTLRIDWTSGKAKPLPPPPPPSPQLLDVLDRAARYCERLKGSAFRFLCQEEVQERWLERDPANRRNVEKTNRWAYDYQIVGGDRRIQERRILLRENSRTTREENAVLKTRFVPRYGYFLPLTYLGLTEREQFRFREEGEEKIKGRRCLIVAALPAVASQAGAGARLWVDRETGAVLKIELKPRDIRGYAALEAQAKRMEAELDVTDIHWFLEERQGLRFPSSTMFREAYVFGYRLESMRVAGGGTVESPRSGVTTPRPNVNPGMQMPVADKREVEFTRIDISYSDYRHFEVQTATEVKEP